MIESRKKPSGVILITAMIILAILLSISMAFASIIISDIRQADTIDDAVGAYYGAEAGMEKSLYLLRKNETIKYVGTYGTSDPTKLLGIDYMTNTNSTKLASSSASWSIASSTDFEATALRQRLYVGQGVKFYFKDRSASNLVRSIGVTWHRNEGTSGSKMQISFTQLSPQQNSNNNYIYYTDRSNVEVSDSKTSPIEKCYKFLDKKLDGTDLLNPIDYVVEIKSLGSGSDYIDRLEVRGYSNEGCGTYYNKAINNMTVRSIGSFGRAKQEIFASIPPTDPVSGLLSFVLFSERDITKDY